MGGWIDQPNEPTPTKLDWSNKSTYPLPRLTMVKLLDHGELSETKWNNKRKWTKKFPKKKSQTLPLSDKFSNSIIIINNFLSLFFLPACSTFRVSITT